MVPDSLDNKFKVRLEGTISGDLVVFNTQPVFSESSTATYAEISPTHSIGTFQLYENSPSRHFELNDIKLVSRNSQEARQNLQKILRLKGWTKSYFGETTGSAANNSVGNSDSMKDIQKNALDEMKNWLGAPPEILLFSAYSTDYNLGHMNKIPVVLKALTVQYPNDVDYIPTAQLNSTDTLGGTPFPLLVTIAVSLIEQHSAYELEQFNLASYRNGILPSF